MKKARNTRRRSQEGIALLIAIFVLLLVSVVAIALLVSSGTETALGANYRASSTVYYAALAGLEEGRGRLLPKNPNYFGISYIPSPFPVGQTFYMINRFTGDNIAPWDQANQYYDKEYKTEFGVEASSTSWGSRPSVWDNNAQGIPGPVFKWVRINAVTEQAIFTDVNNNGSWDLTPLYYDLGHVDFNGNAWPSLVVGSTATATQALEITALAELPSGSKKILQYLVAPVTLNLSFPAALTMDGYSDAFSSPDHSAFQISGNSDGGDPACSSMPYPVPAIGVPDSLDVNYVKNGNPGPGSTGIPVSPTNETGNFTGTGPTPSVAQVLPPPNIQTVQSLDQISQIVFQNADATLAGPATEANLPAAMSNSNPMTIAVQGDFHLGSGFTGYGLLLVTGNFTYDTGSNWNGIVLVIGQGSVAATENGAGGTFNGAMLVAQTRDSLGNLLPGPHPGPATFTDTVGPNVGRGIIYNCSWIKSSQAPITYKVLSFHEIPQS
ncbi:MAG TPA: pilus assembly PilX N-terminal domain-containing protein [Candidatus Solibacter sp.]|nr:pilus assembly PilX N-terminal domain-containing protein [Candidatus Solibacter sp.]